MDVLPSFPARSSDRNEIEENLPQGVQLSLSEIHFYWRPKEMSPQEATIA
jgi:hypothetical protein